MSLLIAALGICFLLLLMIRFQLNAFIALVITALAVGVAEGMSIEKALSAVVEGMGSTLGSLALILAFGAMLGKLIEESGAAHSIAYRLIKWLGEKNMQWAMLITGFMVGIPMMYSAGFLVIIPLLYAIASTTKRSLLFVGIPMCSALSVAFGLLPPHPAPSAIAVLYEGNINLTMVYGLLIAIPAILLSGPFLSRFFNKWMVYPPEELFTNRTFKPDELPSFGVSVFVTLLPVLLMLTGLDVNLSLLLAVLAGSLLLRNKRPWKEVMYSLSQSVTGIAMMMLIIGAGGALKQVLLDSGVSNDMKEVALGLHWSPLVLAWCIAAILRLAVGSATVAAITAAGIVLPLVKDSGIRPELMVLATSSGSLMFSHVNDVGFWMFKQYFNLNMKQTFLTWTVMECIVAITGLMGVLLLNMFL